MVAVPGRHEPARTCDLCPRLVAYREENTTAEPTWHNAPVPAFGDLDAPLLVVGLAPGRRGANRTGRPFTGDDAGDLLYPALLKFGFASGTYDARPDDGLKLTDCRITNAVRCVPPKNVVKGPEKTACRPFLIEEMRAMPNLRIILALGTVAHEQVLRAFGIKPKAFPFKHGALHTLPGPATGPGALLLANTYHCSRYNVNTRVLTREMFEDIFATVRTRLDDAA